MRRRALLAVALALLAGGPEGPPLRPSTLFAQPRTGGIVFVGSSIFHRWTSLQSQMAPLPVTNLAIDGTVTSDMLAMLNSRILPLRPKVVAYYCGSNDVDLGEPARAYSVQQAGIDHFVQHPAGAAEQERHRILPRLQRSTRYVAVHSRRTPRSFLHRQVHTTLRLLNAGGPEGPPLRRSSLFLERGVTGYVNLHEAGRLTLVVDDESIADSDAFEHRLRSR